MSTVTSKDGTPIAYSRSGNGPPLIVVDGALCTRTFGPTPKLAPLLAQHFTTFVYDRRGRGASGDRTPYALERELEDLEALLREAGGSAIVLGFSSGAALALEAAARGLPISRVVAYEPPYVAGDGRDHSGHEAKLRELLSAGNRGAAVRYFMRDMVGVPLPFVVMMQLMRGTWAKLKAVAHTLPYDAAAMNRFAVPTERFAKIRVPAAVMYGGKTGPRLERAARSAAEAIPGAECRALPGQSHEVDPKVLTSDLVAQLNA